jgi:hypothetical protein
MRDMATKKRKKAKKQTSPKVSTAASKILRGKRASSKAKKMVAASALAQDETKGQGKKKARKKPTKKGRKKAKR